MLKEICFYAICMLHVIIWIFVQLAFLNPKLAYINLFYIIPFIYIMHILPFHVLNESKKNMYPNDHEDMIDKFSKLTILPNLHKKAEIVLDKFCFKSPINPQGMLIFGALTSAYALKFHRKIC